MTNDDPHFQTVADWKEAEHVMGFRPGVPRDTAGYSLQALRLFIMDHKKRRVPPEQRSLEAHYGGFVLSQSKPGPGEAERLALESRYGANPHTCRVSGHEGHWYERGPEVPDDDPDGRTPAIVTWANGPIFYLLASTEQEADRLLEIASTVRA